MLTTTLERIRACNPCETGWGKLLRHLGKTRADDDVLPYAVILDSNGLFDALWCCQCEPQHHREWRLFAVWCARQVQHLTRDPRSVAALDVATRHANGVATDEDLAAAGAAAWGAARAAAWGAGDAAWGAARAAAWAAGDAAWAAARAARAAAWAAEAAAWGAACDAQARAFRQLVTTGKLPL